MECVSVFTYFYFWNAYITSLKTIITRFFVFDTLSKQLLLAPKDIPDKDFEYFRIFIELMVIYLTAQCIHNWGLDYASLD
jgi:hypothetical protein